MGSAPFYYLQIDLLCIAILLILFCNLRMSGDHRSQQLCLARALLSSVVAIFFDAIWNSICAGLIRLPLAASYLVNICYFASDGIMCFFWTYYSEHIQQSGLLHSKRQRLEMLIAPMTVLLLAAVSPWTGWLFRLGENGEYIRGPLFVLFILVCYGVPVFSLVKALIFSFRKRYESRRSELRILASFVVYPFIAGILQILLPGTPSLCIGIVLAALTVFIFMQNRLISLDPLTGLNNRYQLQSYLSKKLPDCRNPSKHPLFMIILDVDDFKSVNDTFGHVEGDRALTKVADAMRLACHSTSAFIARLGGDEFLILIEGEEQQAIDICSLLSNRLAEVSEGLPYSLHACYGIAAYPGGGVTAQQFLAMADEKLYESKRNLKRRR